METEQGDGGVFVRHLDAKNQDEGPCETDPSCRYLRYPVLLGRGAWKRVYKAFDQQEGIEVAWNQVELSGNHLDDTQRERLFAEIRVLKQLTHKNIMSFHDWWYDARTATINFITEYFTSGTLRQYRKKHRSISETAIKRWAYQILEGLVYLHAHDPPIVHRDLKCDNILVNGTSGVVKIGDLGLASCRRGLSVVGTPEFMAPEIYDEVYDEKVDIYSFGMCMLELATMEYPYSECRSVPAIFRKVSQGIPPAGLARVQNEELQSFVTMCIGFDPTQRPSALALLKHGFFNSLRADSSCSSPTLAWSIMARSFSPVVSYSNLSCLARGHGHHGSSCSDAHPGGCGGPPSAPGTPTAAAAAAARLGGGTRGSGGGFAERAAELLAECHEAGCVEAGCHEAASREALSGGAAEQAPGAEAHRAATACGSCGGAEPPAAAAVEAALLPLPRLPPLQQLRPPGERRHEVARKLAEAAAEAAERQRRLEREEAEEAAAEAAAKRRGLTVCVAALKGAPVQSDEADGDSDDDDDEVICSLADVLQLDDGSGSSDEECDGFEGTRSWSPEFAGAAGAASRRSFEGPWGAALRLREPSAGGAAAACGGAAAPGTAGGAEALGRAPSGAAAAAAAAADMLASGWRCGGDGAPPQLSARASRAGSLAAAAAGASSPGGGNSGSGSCGLQGSRPGSSLSKPGGGSLLQLPSGHLIPMCTVLDKIIRHRHAASDLQPWISQLLQWDQDGTCGGAGSGDGGAGAGAPADALAAAMGAAAAAAARALHHQQTQPAAGRDSVVGAVVVASPLDMGRIVVRRKFARGLHGVLNITKRSTTL